MSEQQSQPKEPRRIIVTRAPTSLPEQPLPTAAAPPSPPRQRRIPWVGISCLVLTLLCVVVVAVPILLGVDVVGKVVAGVNYVVEGLQHGFETQPEAAVITGATVVNSIQPLGQLVSIEMQLAKANMQVNIQQGLLNACSFSAKYVADGAVEAGIDLMQVGDADVSYNALTDTYTITLPAPQLTSCRIEFVDQYGESLTLCSVDWDSARQLGQYIALTEFRDDALEGQILQRAQQQTTLVIGNFVRSLTGSNVEIAYREFQTALPPSCDPKPPDPWLYDAESRAWIQP